MESILFEWKSKTVILKSYTNHMHGQCGQNNCAPYWKVVTEVDIICICKEYLSQQSSFIELK